MRDSRFGGAVLRIATFVFGLVLVSIAAGAAQAGGPPCQPGSYGANGFEPCTPCDAGTFAPNPGSTACDPCPIGAYASSTGSASCALCDPGSAAPTTGSITCAPCEPGSVIDYAGASACLDCGPGYYADQPGMTSCLLCNAGSFAAEAGSSSCEPCAAGSYNETLGAASCVTCSPGTYSSEIGAISSASCTPCTAGEFSADAGASACAACPRNAYAPLDGATQCLVCGCDDATACTRDACHAVTGACSAPPVPACQPIEVAFEGGVSYVDPRLGSVVTLGDPVAGRFVFDPEAPDETPLSGTFGDYPNGVTSFEVAIGFGAVISASSAAGRVTVVNDWLSGDYVAFEAAAADGLVATPIDVPADGSAASYRMRFTDTDASALANDLLPQGPLAFGDFPIRWTSLEIASPTLGNLYIEAEPVADAPEPASLLAGLAALAAVVAVARPRSRIS